MSGHLDGLHESFRLAARPNLAAHRTDLVRVRGDHRRGLHQLVDHVGCLGRTGAEAITHVHDRELCVVVVAHHQFLVREDAGVAGEVGHEPVAEPKDIPGGQADVSGDARFLHGLAEVAADEVGIHAVAVQRRHRGDAHATKGHAAAEAGEDRVGGVAAVRLELGSEEGRHLAAGHDLRFLASAMFTALVLGTSDTDMSGFSQLPEFGALLCAFPMWSPCM